MPNYTNVRVFSVKEGRKLAQFNEAEGILVKNEMVTITGLEKYKKKHIFMAPKSEVFIEFEKIRNKEKE